MTTPSRPTSNDINAAINSAARRMMATASSSDLRARVMSRIETTERSPFSRWGWRLAIAGGAMGAVALTTAVVWNTYGLTSAPDDSTVRVASSDAAHPTSAPANKIDPTPSSIAASPVVTTASVRRAARQQIIEVSAAELAWRARGVQALEQPEALNIEPLVHERFSIDPIDIAPLRVAPLTVPASGDGGSK